jgi:hypothetical protein
LRAMHRDLRVEHPSSDLPRTIERFQRNTVSQPFSSVMHSNRSSAFVFLVALASFAVSARAQQAVGLTSTGSLVSFNISSPATPLNTVTVSGLGGGEMLVGLDYRPLTRALVGVTSQSRLVTLNPETGVATVLSTLNVPLTGASFGVDFNPVPDRLRVVSNTGQNLRINVDTGAVTVDGTLAYAVADTNAGSTPQVVAAGYTNAVAGRVAVSTTLYDIDFAKDILVRQDPPNNGTLVTVGPLGVDFTANSDIDIFSPNLGYAVNNNNTTSSLYRINLATGAATLAGTFPAGILITDFAIEPKEAALGIVNTSARGMIATGEGALFTGFVIGGNAPVNVLVVARGPSLTQFGVTSAIADTRVSLWRGPTQLDANDDWQTHPRSADIMASTFAPGNPRESAVLMTLTPGTYTAVINGSGTATTGVAIVEVYELP